MKPITLVYMVNATLLLLHEIESAYEREWEIFKLPGNLTGFLLVHIPMILLIFYGLIEIEKTTTAGLTCGIIFGIGGVIPFIVHKLCFKRPGQFNLPVSSAIIYLNTLSGIALSVLSGRLIA